MPATASKIGFMQGRLSPIIDAKIQAFPWEHWKNEFSLAEKIQIPLMEWTLDHYNLSESPLMSPLGRKEIMSLSRKHGVRVKSVTGDFFMQAPFFKFSGGKKNELLQELKAILEASSELGANFLVMPLVDNGGITNPGEEKDVVASLSKLAPFLEAKNISIVFESDYQPKELGRFISFFPEKFFGINYDSGNSASLGFDPQEEISIYGHRIYNVHIKDRVLNGTTVPLGTGNANFPAVFKGLYTAHYQGNYILQTARAQNKDHQGVLEKYFKMTKTWIIEAGSTL